MAFSHGSKAKVLVNGYDLSNYLRSVSFSALADTAETTTLGSTAKTYIPGLQDATVSAEGIYDGSPKAVDEILQAALGAESTIWVYLPQGDGVGKSGFGIECIETSYEIESPVDDVAAISVEAQSKVGREQVVVLADLQTRTASGNGSTRDDGASSSDGAVGYLQVLGLSGSGAALTVTIQHSSDGSNWSSLINFPQVSTSGVPKAQRIAVQGTVNRYVRAIWTLSGTNPQATFHVAFCRLKK